MLQTPAEPKKYTTAYSDFRGVDFTNDETNVWKRRTPSGLNMMPDEAGRPWKRTGWEIVVPKGEYFSSVTGLKTVTLGGKERVMIHAGTSVYDYHDDTVTELDAESDAGRCFYFESGGTEGFYMPYYRKTFSQGENDVVYKYDGETVEQIEPYIPTVLISRDPSGGGTLYESVNLLSYKRKESFLGNDTDLEYFVSSEIFRDVVVEVKNEVGVYEVLSSDSYTIGTNSITFTEPKPPVVEGEDNVLITYSTPTSVYEKGDVEYIPVDDDYVTWEPAESGSGYTSVLNVKRKLIDAIISENDDGTPKVEVSFWDGYSEQWVAVNSSDYFISYESDGYAYINLIPRGEDYPDTQLQYDGTVRFEVVYYFKRPRMTGARKGFSQCRTNTIYGTGLANSVFMSASTADGYKSRVWYSKVGDPTYFPDLNYFEAGSNNTDIVGLAKVGEFLGVIKQGDSEDASIYLAYPVSFDDDTAYAVKQSVSGVGAVSINGINTLGDELLFFSKEGIMAVDVTANENERKLRNRSYYLNKKLLAEPNLELATSYVWNGFYFLSLNTHCYILDGAQKTSWANEKTNLQYEGYYWENIDAKYFAHYNEALWFADSEGNLCRMKKYEEVGNLAYNDNNEPIQCEWSTILDNDGATNYFKNLQKKGCLVTLLPLPSTGAEVYVRADGKNPELVGEISAENPTVPIEFYLNKKVKKYKRLQIIVKNDNLNQGFGLQEIIKIYTIGNYSKNRG